MQQFFLHQVFQLAEEAADSYQQCGGQLTALHKFGQDPLDGCANLQNARHCGFISKYPDFESIFSDSVNNNSDPFRLGLMHFISLTVRLAHSV